MSITRQNNRLTKAEIQNLFTQNHHVCCSILFGDQTAQNTNRTRAKYYHMMSLAYSGSIACVNSDA